MSTTVLDDTMSIFDPNLNQLYFNQLASQQNINIFIYRKLVELRDRYVAFTKQQNENNTIFVASIEDHKTRIATAESNIKVINETIENLDKYARTLNGDLIQHKMNVDQQFTLYTNSINAISTQGDNLTAKVTNLESALTTLKSNINAEKLQAFIDSHQTLLNDVDDKIANQINPISDELATFQAEVNDQFALFQKQADQNKTTLSNQLEQYNASQVTTINNFIKQANEAINSNATQAKNDDDILRNALQSQINSEKADRITADNEMQSKFNAFSANTNAMFSSLQTEWETYQATVTSRLDNFHSYLVTNINRIDNDIIKAQQSLNERIDAEVKTGNERIDSEVATLNNTIDANKTENQQQHSEITAKIKSVASGAKSDDDKLQAQITETDSKVSDYNKRVEAVEASDKTQNEQIAKFIEQLTAIQTGQNNLVGYFNQLSQEIKDETANRVSEINKLSKTIGNFGTRIDNSEKEIDDLLELIKFAHVVEFDVPSGSNQAGGSVEFNYGTITYSTDGFSRLNLSIALSNDVRVLRSANGGAFSSPNVSSGAVVNTFNVQLSTSQQLQPYAEHYYIFDETGSVVKPYEINMFFNPLTAKFIIYSNSAYTKDV